jgi:hypothetical protein
MSKSVTPLKKMSTKSIVGKMPKIEKDQEIWLFDLYGQVSDTKTGVSSYGDWTALLGSFTARRVADGKLFASRTLHVPDALQDVILDAMSNGDVEFSARVGIVGVPDRADASVVKYEYRIEMTAAPETVDEIERQLSKLPPPLAIAAPVAATEAAPVAATEAAPVAATEAAPVAATEAEGKKGKAA